MNQYDLHKHTDLICNKCNTRKAEILIQFDNGITETRCLTKSCGVR